jgi:hypothetical protein
MHDKHTVFHYKSIYMSFVLPGVYTYAPFYMQKMLGFFLQFKESQTPMIMFSETQKIDTSNMTRKGLHVREL